MELKGAVVNCGGDLHPRMELKGAVVNCGGDCILHEIFVGTGRVLAIRLCWCAMPNVCALRFV